jgi:hypothetical protein
MATIPSGVDPTAGPAESGITLEQALEAHLGERDLSVRTAEDYRYHVDKYLTRFRRRAVADISRPACRDLLDTLTRRSGRTTAASVLRTLRALVNTAMRRDETIERNPVDAVRVPVAPRRKVDKLDVAAFCATTAQLSPTMRDLHRALLLTGAQRTSMLTVRREDFDPGRGVITFTHMKTGGSMAFPTGRWLTAALRARLEEDEPLGSPWLWPSLTSASGHIEEPKRSGLPSPHAPRHHARTRRDGCLAPHHRRRQIHRRRRQQRRRPEPRRVTRPRHQNSAIAFIALSMISNASPGGRPRTAANREIVEAILYLLRAGCA